MNEVGKHSEYIGKLSSETEKLSTKGIKTLNNMVKNMPKASG